MQVKPIDFLIARIGGESLGRSQDDQQLFFNLKITLFWLDVAIPFYKVVGDSPGWLGDAGLASVSSQPPTS